MVTIEQKLTLFSKLLNQDIKAEIEQKNLEIEQEYQTIMKKNKERVDQMAVEVMDQAKARGEMKCVEIVSKSKVVSKKRVMQVKEEMIDEMLDKLIKRSEAFTKTPAYLEYLQKEMKELPELKAYANPLEIYMTAYDYEQNLEFLKALFQGLGIAPAHLNFKKGEEAMIGGLVIVDESLNMKVDCSMKAIIDEAKEHIVEVITEALQEVGDENDD